MCLFTERSFQFGALLNKPNEKKLIQQNTSIEKFISFTALGDNFFIQVSFRFLRQFDKIKSLAVLKEKKKIQIGPIIIIAII